MRVAAIIFLMLIRPAVAAETGQKSFADLYPPMPGVEYFCLDRHETRHELGQVICVSASCQTWMAKCDMSQNNTTWRKISDGCPSVDLLERLRTLADQKLS